MRNGIILLVAGVVAAAFGLALRGLFGPYFPTDDTIFVADWFPFLGDRNSVFGGTPVWVAVVLGVPGFWLVSRLVDWSESDDFKMMMAESSKTSRLWSRSEKFGKGGSAAFGGLLDEWDDLYKPGDVFLGRSMYDRSRIGSSDPRGVLTIASSRSGKGRSAIMPNLLMWPGSALIIDPKGTNAAVTALARGQGGGRLTHWLGQDVHVVDPFGIVKDVEGAGFNPLADIDIDSLTANEDIELLAEALVEPEREGGSNTKHFEESARIIIGGVIAFVLETFNNPTLMDVRAGLVQPDDRRAEMFKRMMDSTAAGGMPRNAATLVRSAGNQELGGMMTTVLRHTAWLDAPAMRQVLTRSSFVMGDLKKRPTSVYLVLPPEMLKIHGRFLRMFVNMTLSAVPRGGRSETPILMLMDEFYALGRLDSLVKASGALAGYNLRLWPMLQNISQLKELYPQNWQSFFANAGAVQVFGVNDTETAREVARMLGRRAVEEVRDGKTFRTMVNLIEEEELGEALSIDDGRQLILRSGRTPLLLKKLNYDRAFKRSEYMPDPDYREEVGWWEYWK
ncbi:type IV secretory system conjugative DNA transfer family protein [Arvimicrobium flavum]|uniref:type IV secretory system conjugative DNA transfer family protein n=1 Tax=Arvimicrobium flavum TaxID=3393320 RepID=UPI00237A338E|nr:type IV secretory system conjugative DNA transfer family protein [Mesorhizobium shangrilense]